MKLEMSASPPLSEYMGNSNMMPPTMLVEKSSSPPLTNQTRRKKATFFSIDQILGRKEEEMEDEVFEDEHKVGEEDSNVSDSDDPIKVDGEMTVDEVEKDGSDRDSKNDKQTPSYTAIIAQAILSSSEKKLPLGCIYDYIAEHFPEFLKKGQGWRNCVRHNLSLSECFVKAGRARNGRGNYWGIHPRYIKNFSKGDFRKRRASHRPRNRDLGYLAGRYFPHYYNPFMMPSPFPKQHIPVPHRNFTVDSILSPESVEHGPPTLISSYKPWLRVAPPHGELAKEYSPPHKYHMLSSPPALPPVSHVPEFYSSQRNISPTHKTYDYHGKVTCSCHHYSCCQPTRT